MEDLHHHQGVHGHGAGQIDRVAAIDGVGVDAEHAAEEQGGDEEDMPAQRAGQQRLAPAPGRAAHGVLFGRLEGQRHAQRDGGDQVDPEDLHRRDRQRHAEQQGDDDGHGLASIGRQGPADDFLDVVIDGPALAHGGRDRGEIVVRQNQLGRLLRRLAALQPHGDARIGALQGRGVIDAVSGHGDGQAVRLQRHHQP